MSSKFGISQFTRRKVGFYFLCLSLAFPSFLSIPSLSLNAYFYFSSLLLVPPFFHSLFLSLFLSMTLCFFLHSNPPPFSTSPFLFLYHCLYFFSLSSLPPYLRPLFLPLYLAISLFSLSPPFTFSACLPLPV